MEKGFTFMKRSVWQYLSAAVALLTVSITTAQSQGFVENYAGAPIANASGGGPATTLGVYNPISYFSAAGQIWYIRTKPVRPVALANPGAFQPNNANYIDVLSAAFPNADFTPGNALTGTVDIKTYATYARGTAVGEEFYATYNPGMGDPVYTASNNLAGGANGMHWMQVISNTWAIVGGVGQPGVSFTGVDNLGSNNPYYDSLGAANGTTFFDSPQRITNNAPLPGPPGIPLQWTAEMFLVDQTGNDPISGAPIINVYAGVQYGFEVGTPEPGTFAYLAVFSGSAIVCIRRRRRMAK